MKKQFYIFWCHQSFLGIQKNKTIKMWIHKKNICIYSFQLKKISIAYTIVADAMQYVNRAYLKFSTSHSSRIKIGNSYTDRL